MSCILCLKLLQKWLTKHQVLSLLSMSGAISQDILSGKGSSSPTLKWINSEIIAGIKQGSNLCSWSWLFYFSFPNTFVMNQCLKSYISWFLSFFFCLTDLIFWHFSPKFLRLSLGSFILFPLIFFPTSSALSLNPFCEFSSSLQRLYFSQLLSSHL